MRVAILGANGFVGHRLFESWQTGGLHQPRAIVRSPSSLARIARFDADWRLADARDARALAAALAGCDAVVHCVLGDAPMIKATIDPVVRAATTAGVSKLVYLSSASVHGQNPPADTTETSRLPTDHPLPYNNAKVWAECRLQRQVRGTGMSVAMLRPGIVFGPRSRWVSDVADALTARAAAWIDGGRGICNSIYIDNLVHAIECALAVDRLGGEPYLVGDAEVVTWRDLYLGIAAGLGYDESAFAEATATAPRPLGLAQRLDAIRVSEIAQRVIARVPRAPKDAVKAALAAWRKPAPLDRWALPPTQTRPVASVEMSLLFACRTKFPHAKAAGQLGYAPPVTFVQGVARSVAWLRAAGYPAAPSASANRV